MTRGEAKVLADLAGSILVVRAQQLETNRILKALTGVLSDLQITNEGIRLELTHLRTRREQTDRSEALAAMVGQQPQKTG